MRLDFAERVPVRWIVSPLHGLTKVSSSGRVKETWLATRRASAGPGVAAAVGPASASQPVIRAATKKAVPVKVSERIVVFSRVGSLRRVFLLGYAPVPVEKRHPGSARVLLGSGDRRCGQAAETASSAGDPTPARRPERVTTSSSMDKL